MNSKTGKVLVKMAQKVAEADIKRNSLWPICCAFFHQPKRPEKLPGELMENKTNRVLDSNHQ